MPKPGRKSLDDLKDVSALPQRPEPPETMPAEQAEEWRKIVGRMPVDWFKAEHYPVLDALCHHIVRERKCSRALTAMDPAGDPKAYDDLSKTADRESKAVLACMRSLRLTLQSQYDAAKAQRKSSSGASVEKPWSRSG